MLPPFIIDQIREREEERGRDVRPQPTLELPMPIEHSEPPASDDSDRGVIIIDLLAD